MYTDPVSLMFRAYSDPTRLRILHLLLAGELCVGDLVTVLGVPQPTGSRHLRYLRRAGLVTVRKEGRWAFYSLAAARDEFHERLLACLGGCFALVPEVAADGKKLRKLRRSGGCCDEAPRRRGRKARDEATARG